MLGNIFGEILTWSKELAPWQNEAIRRLFLKGTLSVPELDTVFQLAEIEHKLLPPAPTPTNLMLQASDLPTPPVPGQKIKLKSVQIVENVNALKPNERLSIGNQLTVIYGENASGKSGYARVMKKAFRARAVDPVLPNVYMPAPSGRKPASAAFEVEENGTVQREVWIDGKPSPECLGRFAVFDVKCARVYISDNNQLSFLPYGFDIIDGIGTVTTEIKRRFQELATRTAPKPDALKPLIDDSMTGRLLGVLNAGIKEEDIRTLAIWSDVDSVTLQSKEAELARLKANAPKSLRDALNGRRRQLVTARDLAITTADVISDASVAEIHRKAQELAKFEQAVVAAAKLAFGDLDMPGIGSEIWRELIMAAATYSTQLAFPGGQFPAAGLAAKCVLCLQPLDAGAQERLARFWAFIQDDVSNKRDIAKQALEVDRETLAKLPRALPPEIEILEETLRATGSGVFEKMKEFYRSAAVRISAVESATSGGDWSVIPPAPDSPGSTCAAEIAAIDRDLKAIVDDEQVTRTISLLAADVRELTARKRLKEHLEQVLDHLNALKISGRATAAANKITTNGISLKAAELQARFVTEAFKRRVQDELRPLDLTRVKAGIDKKSEKGKVLHRLTVDGTSGVPPESVFSEGERTAISVSCFLAELSSSDDNCGIIFDDPVSSLDHRVREAIVKRLVSEAALRQVIVFTHDLVCYRELVAAAERQKINVHIQNVEALGGTTGILSSVPPLPAQKVSERIIHLEELLKLAKSAETAADIISYKIAAMEFYDLLRSTWERSVEEVLFDQVVQRLEKEVKTMRLDGVCVDSESITAVFDGMTRASAMTAAHDHASAENPTLPSSGKLLDDLNHFKAFLTRQKYKCKAAREQNAHLKK